MRPFDFLVAGTYFLSVTSGQNGGPVPTTASYNLQASVEGHALGFDPTLTLHSADGGIIATSFDHSTVDSGSNSLSDPFLEVIFPAAGSYFITVTSGRDFAAISSFASYTLQASVENHAVNESIRPNLVAIESTNRVELTVIYSDLDGLDISTIDRNDISIVEAATGNNLSPATDVIINSTDLTNVVVTYYLEAADGNWDPLDFGVYQISLKPNEVKNKAGVSAVARSLGSFRVRIENDTSVIATTFDDTTDANFEDLASIDSADKVSLRSAIQQANQTAAARFIFLNEGVYRLTLDDAVDDAPDDSLASPQLISASAWNLLDDDTITSSTTIPHATVKGTGGLNSDYFGFEVSSAGVRGVFDIDFGMLGQFDGELRLYNSSGTLLATNLDQFIVDVGSSDLKDPLLDFTFPSAGNYVIEVKQQGPAAQVAEQFYRLHLSVENHPLEPGKENTDESRSGDLDIRGNITIAGAGAGTIIDAQGIDRVFDVYPGAQLTLMNVTVMGGLADSGGGIRTREPGTIQFPSRAFELFSDGQNHTFFTAQDIDAATNWDQEIRSDVVESEALPHVTITNFSGGTDQDFYRFTVGSAGDRGIFDIDLGGFTGPMASTLTLFAADSTVLATSSDPSNTAIFDADDPMNPFLDITFPSAGTYFVGVTSESVFYSLHVSVENHATNLITSMVNGGVATLERVTIEGNQANQGGGIVNNGVIVVNRPKMEITPTPVPATPAVSVIANNTSVLPGGGIYESVTGVTTIYTTSIEGNVALGHSSAAIQSNGTLTIIGSTISGHDDRESDTTIEITGPGANLIERTTLSGNTGRRLLQVSESGNVTLRHTTIVANNVEDAVVIDGTPFIEPPILGQEILAELEPNDSLAFPQNVDLVATAPWNLLSNFEIENSTLIPHLTIAATGNGSVDLYQFSVANPGTQAIFDIDNSSFQFSSSTSEIEPNDSLVSPQNIDAANNWSLIETFEITQSNQIPHTSIIGSGNGTVDVYEFQVSAAGTRGIFDIDNSSSDLGLAFHFEREPNDTLSTADVIDDSTWDINDDEFITDSTSIPHVTIQGFGDDSVDFYQFTVSDAGLRGIFDIDFGSSFDSTLTLLAPDGSILATNFDQTEIDSGSDALTDAYLDFLFPSAGTYSIAVSSGPSEDSIPLFESYLLSISIQDHAITANPFERFDPTLTLHSADGTILATSLDQPLDEFGLPILDVGSFSASDPFLDFVFLTPGTYYITVSSGPDSDTIPFGANYTLNASVENHEIAFDPTLTLFAADGSVLANIDGQPLDPFGLPNIDFGSSTVNDPRFNYVFTEAGTYYIAVSSGTNFASIPQGDSYRLHLSVEDHATDPRFDIHPSPATATIADSLIVGNNGSDVRIEAGRLISGGLNLLGSVASEREAAIFDSKNRDRIQRDAALFVAPLADNGSGLLTHMLLAGSAAILEGGIDDDIGALERTVGSIQGMVYFDRDGDRARDANEPGIADIVVFVDLDRDGQRDDNEPFTVTARDDSMTANLVETGSYKFDQVEAGNVVVRLLRPENFVSTEVGFGSIERVSLQPNEFVPSGTESAFDSFGASLSADGRYVAYGQYSGANPTTIQYLVYDRQRDQIDIIPNPTLTFAEAEPNNSLLEAQIIDAEAWSLQFDENITNSTTIPHLTLPGTGDGSFDFYAFRVNAAGQRGVFDIDQADSGLGFFDAELFLFDSNSVLLAKNDDSVSTNGGTGSFSSLDSYIDYTFSAPGTYIIAVGRFPSDGPEVGFQGNVTGEAPAQGHTYTLQISIEGHTLSNSLLTGTVDTPSISDDGNLVAFVTKPSSTSANGFSDVYLYNRMTDAIVRVSVPQAGTVADGNSSDPQISADSRYIVFTSQNSNLVDDDDNGVSDVFLYDVVDKTIRRLSSPLVSGAYRPTVSGDGMFVAFASIPSGADNHSDLFLWSRETSDVTLVTSGVGGAASQCLASSVFCNLTTPDISDNGQFIVFRSNAINLVPGDTNLRSDVFVFDRISDRIDRVLYNVGGGQPVALDGTALSISSDGRFIAFESNAEVIPGVRGASGSSSTYVIARTTGTVELVSQSLSNRAGNATRTTEPLTPLTTAISADGSTVAFQSFSNNLVSNDFNGRSDVFVRSTPALARRESATLLFAASESIVDLNFGIVPLPGRISGQVFEDLSRIGSDAFGPGIPNVQVYLDVNENRMFDSGEPNQFTDEAGNYSFDNVPAFTEYDIGAVTPIGFTQVIPSSARGGVLQTFLPARGRVIELDFGFVRLQSGGQFQNSTLSGRVFDDVNSDRIQQPTERGVGGITVFLDFDDDGVRDANEPRMVTTSDDPGTEADEAGFYTFSNLGNRAFVVRTLLDEFTIQTNPQNSQFTTSALMLRDVAGQFSNVADVIAEDLDSTNGRDIAVVLYDANQVLIRLNNGDGTFNTTGIPVSVAPDGNGPIALVAANLNGNGLQDLVVANNLSRNITVLLDFNGTGFSSVLPYAVGRGPVDIAIADFDGRNGNDIAVINLTDDTISILLNDGQGAFVTSQTIPSGGRSPSSIVAGDFDGDTIVELAITHSGAGDNPGNVAIMRNLGNGTFGLQQTYAVGRRPSSVVAADFNNDQLVDLAVANFGSNTASILRGTGGGNFSVLPNQLAVGQGPFQIGTADIERDGDIDLLVTNLLSQQVSILRNAPARGDFSFEPAENFGVVSSVATETLSFAVADLNFDNTQDLVIANSKTDTVRVLLNRLVDGAHRISLDGVSPATDLDFGIKPALARPSFEFESLPAPILEDAVEQTVNLRNIKKGRPLGPDLMILATSDNPAIIPSVTSVLSGGTTATLRYTPLPNAVGSVVITVSVIDAGPNGSFEIPAGSGDDAVFPLSFTVIVGPVNDPPQFSLTPEIAVLQTAGALTVPNFVTDFLNGGGLDESSQNRSISISTNDSFFTIPPTIDSVGTLSLTPSPNQSGPVTVSVTVSDDGGTTNGGLNSTTKTFVVNVLPVNEPPTFDIVSALSVRSDAGPQTIVNFASGFFAGGGDDESSQLVSEYIISTDSPGLFTVLPSIDNLGSLSFTPLLDRDGVALVRVRARDNGGRFNGGNDLSVEKTFTIAVVAIDPANISIVLLGSGETVDISTTPDTRLVTVRTVNIRGTGNNSLRLNSSRINQFTPEQTLTVIADPDDSITFGTGWVAQQPAFINGAFTHIITATIASPGSASPLASGEAGTARVELRNGRFFQNPLNRFDVDRNGVIQPLDALRVINELRRIGTGPLRVPLTDDEISRLYLDVTGEGNLTALDALRILNALVRVGRGVSPEQELELPLVDTLSFTKNHEVISVTPRVETSLPPTVAKQQSSPPTTPASEFLSIDAVDVAMRDFGQEYISDGELMLLSDGAI